MPTSSVALPLGTQIVPVPNTNTDSFVMYGSPDINMYLYSDNWHNAVVDGYDVRSAGELVTTAAGVVWLKVNGYQNGQISFPGFMRLEDQGVVWNALDFALTPPPAVPTNVGASAVSDTVITVHWTTAANFVDIQRTDSENGAWADVAHLPGNQQTYNDTGLKANTTYYYQVRSATASASSDYATRVSATTKAVTPAPGPNPDPAKSGGNGSSNGGTNTGTGGGLNLNEKDTPKTASSSTTGDQTWFQKNQTLVLAGVGALVVLVVVLLTAGRRD